jgi:hypothetical protein
MGCIESQMEMDIENRDISSSIKGGAMPILLNESVGKHNKKWTLMS